MNRTLKNTLIIAAAVAVIGLIIAIIGFAAGGMQAIYIGSDGVKLASESDDSHSIDQPFADITSIEGDFDLRDIILKEGADFRVESKGVGKNFKIENVNGKLIMSDNANTGFQLGLFGFSNSGQHSDIIITYPAGTAFDSIEIDSDSGKITASDLRAGTLDLDSDMGDIVLSDMTADSMDANIDSGKLDLENVNIGDLKFQLGLGDFTADSYTGKKITGELDSGKAKLSGTVTGPVTITDGLGDVDLTLNGKESSYSYDLTTDLGDIDLAGTKTGSNFTKIYGNNPLLKITTDSGNIRIGF